MKGRNLDYGDLMRALGRCDADCPLTLEAAQTILGCCRAAAQRALAKLVQQGKAVRYRPGEFGPAPEKKE